MGRYRPPQPPTSPYITQAGYQQLEQESRSLWSHRREVVKALSAAAAEGDRSENAEYIYRKKELREIDRRIRYLQKRLPNLTVVSAPPSNTGQIFFGAWVTLVDGDDRTQTYRIVGPDEIAPDRGWISIDSPLAQALMKRLLDDRIQVATPGETRSYRVTAISYTAVT